MSDTNGFDRIRSPLGDADREAIEHARRQCVRDEVLDVVVERVARAIAALRDDDPPQLTLTEVLPIGWRGGAGAASVRRVDSPCVLARIG